MDISRFQSLFRQYIDSSVLRPEVANGLLQRILAVLKPERRE